MTVVLFTRDTELGRNGLNDSSSSSKTLKCISGFAVFRFIRRTSSSDSFHFQSDLVMDEKSGYDEDDAVIMKRRPYDHTAWPKSGDTVKVPYTTSGMRTNAVLFLNVVLFFAC